MKILVNDGGISTRNPQTINNGFATNLLNTNIVHLKGNQLQLHTQIIYTSLLTLYIYFQTYLHGDGVNVLGLVNVGD